MQKTYQVGDTYIANGATREITHRVGPIIVGAPAHGKSAEIIIVRQHKETTEWPDGSVTRKDDEYLPKAHDWGRFGWTTFNVRSAHSIADAMAAHPEADTADNSPWIDIYKEINELTYACSSGWS